jgi:hypothetical protein
LASLGYLSSYDRGHVDNLALNMLPFSSRFFWLSLASLGYLSGYRGYVDNLVLNRLSFSGRFFWLSLASLGYLSGYDRGYVDNLELNRLAFCMLSWWVRRLGTMLMGPTVTVERTLLEV